MSRKQLLAALLSFLLLTGVGGAILAAMALPIAATTGTAANSVTRVFDDLPSEIDFTAPSEQSVILATDGTVLARFYSENRIIAKSEDISDYIKKAAVAIEDERFYQHNGIDAQGLIGAAINNISGRSLAGGSTITQQYVKNALIEEGRIKGSDAIIKSAVERSYARKLNEARYAIAVENQMTKDEILTGYLNLSQFGPSHWGVETASQYFFGTSAKNVTLEQAAMLAGITQSPGKWDPVRNPEQAKYRRDTVLAKMYELNFISKEEFETAVNVSIEDMLNLSPATNGCASAGTSAYFCEYVVKEALKSDILGETREERLQALYRGGLTIHSTLNPKDQKAAYDSLLASVPVDDPSSIEMSITAVEPGTGKIVAMTQNTRFGNASKEDPDATKVNLNVGTDMGGGQGFQAGSSFKVFTLIEWLRSGKSAFQTVPANQRDFPSDMWKISCAPVYTIMPEPYHPMNLEGVGGGTMTVLDVTRQSVNTAYVYMSSQLDLCNIVQTAEKMGVKRGQMATPEQAETLTNRGLQATAGEPLPLEPNPSQVLGSNPVTPLSMANAFATLAAEGEACEPISFTKITDRDGNVIGEQTPQCRQVIDAELAQQTTQVLQHVVSPNGTGKNAVLSGRPAAGKTGTANNDWHAWFVGYTPDLATAVWQGHMEGNVSMFDTVINGKYHREVYGGLYPAKSFKLFMDTALDGKPKQEFTKPKKSATEPAKKAVPDVTGMSQAQATSTLIDAGFGYQIENAYSNVGRGRVSSTYPAAGTKANEGSTIKVGISVGPPPPEPEPSNEPSPETSTKAPEPKDTKKPADSKAKDKAKAKKNKDK